MNNLPEKIEPCAFCGAAPKKAHGYFCPTEGCYFNTEEWVFPEIWNRKQERILAQRQKDFEAGRDHYYSNKHGEMEVYFKNHSFSEWIGR